MNEERTPDRTARQWRKLADQLELDPDETIERVGSLADRMPGRVRAVAKRAVDAGLAQPILDRLAGRLVDHAEACQRRLTAA